MVRGDKRAPLFDLFSISEQSLVKEVKLPPMGSASADAKSHDSLELLGYLDGKRMLGYVGSFSDRKDNVEAFTINDDGDPQSVRQLFISTPQQGVIWEAQLSPNGDKLAWLIFAVKAGEKSWDIDKVDRQIWVSSWEGKNWKLVGDYTPEGSEKFLPTQIRWLTDGKRLSFLCRQKLWIVPAE